MGAQRTPKQKTYETNVGQDSLDIDFLGLQWQFHCLELSLVYGKSDKISLKFTALQMKKNMI